MPLNLDFATLGQVCGQSDRGPEHVLSVAATAGIDEETAANLLGVNPADFAELLASRPSWEAAWTKGRHAGYAYILRALHRSGETNNAGAAKLWLILAGGLDPETRRLIAGLPIEPDGPLAAGRSTIVAPSRLP